MTNTQNKDNPLAKELLRLQQDFNKVTDTLLPSIGVQQPSKEQQI